LRIGIIGIRRIRITGVLAAACVVAIAATHAEAAQAGSGTSIGTTVAIATPAPAAAPQPQSMGLAVGGAVVQGGDSCASVLPYLADYARRGQLRVGCFSPGETQSKAADSLSALSADLVAAPASAGPVWCSTSGDNEWWYTRFSACLSNAPVTYEEYDSKGRKELGTASLSVSQDIELEPTSSTWEESDHVSVKKVTGDVRTLEIGFTASCSSPCSTENASPWAGLQPIQEGETLSGTIAYKDSPTRSPNYIERRYELEITQPGTVPTKPYVNWAGPVTLRCDNLVGNSPGCVVPAYTPTFDVPLSQWGAAAATYAWVQTMLPDHWGSFTAEKPLHRLATYARQKANRDKICRDGTWRKDPAVPNDSCDEYPFAATYESGPMLGLRGSQCAEIEPEKVGGQWDVKLLNAAAVTKAARCVRGHVPGPQNTAAGGALGNFATEQRLVDYDPYWVRITP